MTSLPPRVEGDAGAGTGLVPSRAAMLEQLEGDTDLLRALAHSWIGQVDSLLTEARRGVAEQDADALTRAAHTMKGAAGVFAATEVAERAKQLEIQTAEGRIPDDVSLLLERVEEGARALTASLEEFLEEG